MPMKRTGLPRTHMRGPGSNSEILQRLGGARPDSLQSEHDDTDELQALVLTSSMSWNWGVDAIGLLAV